MPHEPRLHDLPDPGEPLTVFIASTDPACHAWLQRIDWTPDVGMAIALGELQAVYSLMEISRSNSNAGVEHILAQFLAGRAALRRQRDSAQFVRTIRQQLKPEGGPDARP